MDVRAVVVSWSEDAPRGAVSRFCREQGVSRAWFYEVRARCRREGPVAAMAARPRQARSAHPQAVPLAVEDLAVRVRKELTDQGWDAGPISVRTRLQRLGVAAPSRATLARIFTRRGLVVAAPQKRPRSSYRRFEFALVHECWQLDAFVWALADGSCCAVYQVLDDKSRALLASHVTRTETAQGAITVVDRAIAAYQVPALLLTDNGAAFNQTRAGRTSALVTHLSQLGVRAITGRPYHPQTQGKDERVHQTTQRWLRARDPAPNPGALLDLLAVFDQQYNQHRPHQALGLRTPAQALRLGPAASPPTPPTPPAPTTPAAVRAQHRRADSVGKITVGRRVIQLGSEHTGHTVTVITTPATATIFDRRGELIRSVTFEPDRTYYGNGRPRGWYRRTEVSTLT